MSVHQVLAVDVGNTTIHFGVFETSSAYPTTVSTLSLPSSDVCESNFDDASLLGWLPEAETRCYLSSVYPKAGQQISAWIRKNRPALAIRQLRSDEFPIACSLENLTTVGADRIAAAVAANALRTSDRGAIVVDSGTAITVDAVNAEGEFLGGAIAPGWHMSAEALHRVADQLPSIQPIERPPSAIGKNTTDAMQSGIYWGAVGTVRELVSRTRREVACQCDLFVAGRGGEMLAKHLPHATVRPHLVLAGMVLAGESLYQ